jgi:hypothetical protein
MTPDLTNQVTAGLLMLVLLSVLGMAVLLSIFVTGYLKRTRFPRAKSDPDKETKDLDLQRRYLPTIVFNHPQRWLAIRSSNARAVQTALGLHNPTPCSWDEGIAKLNEHSLFISPPVQNWIFVLGHGLPDPADDIDDCFRLLVRLSRSLGHVQFFSTNRAVNHHAWAQAEDGVVRRAYAWAGETLWNQGPKTHAEIELGLKCFDYTENADSISLIQNDSHQSNAEKVIFLAARWSMDPTHVDQSMLSATQGIVGDLYHFRQG